MFCFCHITGKTELAATEHLFLIKLGGSKNQTLLAPMSLFFLQEIGAEPYICTNAGTGTPEEMSDWVEYLQSKR